MIFRENKNLGWIGIDLGTHSVKLAQVVRNGNQFSVKSAAIVPRATIWPNDFSKFKEGISSLRELVVAFELNQGFVGRKAACAITMAVCDVRRMSIPDQSAANIESHVRNELASIDRFKGSDRQFDYWKTDRAFSDNGPPANVLSLPRSWSDQCNSDMNSTRLSCDQLDGIPFSMTRAYSMTEVSDEPIALLDWGYTRATLCVVQNGYPKFVRMLRRSGFRLVVDEIMKGFEVDAQQAREIIVEYGLEEPYKAEWNESRKPANCDEAAIQQSVHDMVLEPVNAISKEINRTIQFLKNQQRALTPKKLVLFGGGGTLRNVVPLLESKIRMHTESWSQSFSANLPGNIPVELMGNAIAMSALAFSKDESVESRKSEGAVL